MHNVSRSTVSFEHNFDCHFVLVFSKCHVIKISKIFGDFVPRDPAFARTFSRRSAILKNRRGEGPGDEVDDYYADNVMDTEVNCLAVSSKRVKRFEEKLNICRGKQELEITSSVYVNG